MRAPGTAAARLSSCLAPASVDISAESFQWQHFGGNILPCRPAVSSPRRRPRRCVVVVAASSSSSSSSLPRRRPRRVVVVAVSSSSSSSRRRRVVSSPRRVIRPASILTPGPHHQCWSSHCRVFASIPRLSSPPGPHHQCWSSRSRVIRPRLYPHRYPHRNPHRYPRPRPSPPHLPVPSYLKPVREGGCSDCEDLARCSEAGGLQRSELQLL